MKLGFIGTGVISEAIIIGLLGSDYPVSEFIVSARSRNVSASLAARSEKVRISEDNQIIVNSSDITFLAVLPQDADVVLSGLQFREGQEIISVIATLSIERLRELTHPNAIITRAIPIPASAERASPTAIFPPSSTVETLFGALGTAIPAKTLDEFDALATASATMGLYFGNLELLAQWLVFQGVAYKDARAYLTSMYLGLANTSSRSKGATFDELRSEHSTPNGLNAQQHEIFLKMGGDKALLGAMDSVSARIKSNR